MKKSIWIFLLAVLVPGVVLGWLALRSAEEQQIIFERRTAELYQKETETLAATVRDAVEAERRAFGDTVHRLLANGDAEALARDFSNTLADAWPRKAIGFALGRDGKMLSPTVAGATANPDLHGFLVDNGSFLSGAEPAMVYAVQGNEKQGGYGWAPRGKSLGNVPQVAHLAEQRSREKESAESLTAQSATQRRTNGVLAATRSLSQAAEALDRSREAGFGNAAAEELRQTSAGGKVSLAPKRKAATAESADAPRPRPDGASFGDGKDKAGTAAGAGLAPTAPPAATAPMPTASTGLKAQAPSAPPVEMQDAPAKSRTAMADAVGKKPGAMPEPMLAKKDLAAATAPADRTISGMDEIAELGKMGDVSDRLGRRVVSATAAPPAEIRALGVAIAENGTPDLQRQNEVKGEESARFAQNRMVEPQQLLGAPTNALSMLMPAAAEFRSLTEGSDEGMVSRFVQDKLDVIFWIRPPESPDMVFGCLVEATDLSELWKAAIEMQGAASRGSNWGSDDQPQYVMALLDDRGRPAATRPVSTAVEDWKRPFVASEIGETLPHWEAALYLASPTALVEGARGLRRTLTFTIVGAVALIALGGWLVVADARRQLALAQQKTDFVSNVSHELKTPLTSIRMFAELMHDRPPPPEKQSQYLRIITVEAERLTRLINNVLDFAKIGRKQKRFEKKPLDLHDVISRVWESQGLHLREAGFATRWEAAPGPYPVLGDDDALAQVLVNLLSNAEKYSTERRDVELHTWLDDGWVNVCVLDRGMGVPKGEERKIFEAFYRAHDSLNSGIQGSGLGLTLAHRVAQEHGGEIKFERRDGGGSRFTLRLPLAKLSDS